MPLHGTYRIRIREIWRHRALALVWCVFATHFAVAQTAVRASTTAPSHHHREAGPVTLTQDDGLSVLAAALEARGGGARPRDCSHLVHTISTSGPASPTRMPVLPISHSGTDDFQRVAQPQPGDLAVWKGHVGIVVNPAQGLFFSRLRSGPGIESYDDQYWKHRGPVRFYRYILAAH